MLCTLGLVPVESRPDALCGLQRPVDLAHGSARIELPADHELLALDQVDDFPVKPAVAGRRPRSAGQDGDGLADWEHSANRLGGAEAHHDGPVLDRVAHGHVPGVGLESTGSRCGSLRPRRSAMAASTGASWGSKAPMVQLAVDGPRPVASAFGLCRRGNAFLGVARYLTCMPASSAVALVLILLGRAGVQC